MSTVYSYRDLIVWNKGIELSLLIYSSTANFPKSEMYGLTSQIRRSSISIPSNIAEGNARGYTADYRRFLQIAFGSSAELETQLILAVKIGYLNEESYKELSGKVNEIMRMLNKLITNLNS